MYETKPDGLVIVQGIGKGENIVRIPDEVDGKAVIGIGESAFYGNPWITNVILGNNIRAIEDRAFMHCEKLQSLTCSRDLKFIGDSAFQYTFLNRIDYFPDKIDHIGDNAFSQSLVSMMSSRTSDKELNNAFSRVPTMIEFTINEGTETIKSFALEETQCMVLNIPESVTTIEPFAFCNMKALCLISYAGTKKRWKKLNKSPYCDYGCHAYEIRCTDGSIYRNPLKLWFRSKSANRMAVKTHTNIKKKDKDVMCEPYLRTATRTVQKKYLADFWLKWMFLGMDYAGLIMNLAGNYKWLSVINILAVGFIHICWPRYN